MEPVALWHLVMGYIKYKKSLHEIEQHLLANKKIAPLENLHVKKFKNSKSNDFITYFSDHGEEVYDNPQRLFAGRNEAAPTSPMYTVPFIIWRSESWKKNNKLTETKKIIHRAYSISDFIHTWSDLAGISFKEFDASRSIVSPLFSQHPVWIGDPKKPEKLRDLQKQPFSNPWKMGYIFP
jgi:heptose-I-phosphate ethanolaminephosphotransferase